MAGKVIHPDLPGFSASSRYLKRPRLDKTLETALQSPVVSVVAGQGYGKTSSVYAFLENYSLISLWVQLSERDNISRRFWENLCACVSLRNAELGKALGGLGFPETERQLDRFYVLVEEAVKEMDCAAPPSGRSPSYVLVYDDFHLIRDPATLRLFDRILAFPLSRISIVLIGRNEPQIRTLAFFSKGILSRITAEDLRFSLEETIAYFALRNLAISQEDAESLYRDTEGWPQVLSLIAQDLIKHNIKEFHYSPEMVKLPLFKMIESSFFSSLSRESRKFLIKLSLGEHWPLELLSEMDQTGTMSGDLEKMSPLIRYDSYLNGYRIHNLLIDFLKEKQGELSPEEQRNVYLKSAAWCLKNNLRMDAAIYYEKARDFESFLNLSLTLPSIISEEMAAFFLAILDRLLVEAEKEMPPCAYAESWLCPEDVLWYLHFALRPKLLFSMNRFDEAAAVCRRAIDLFREPAPGSMGARVLAAAYVCLGFIEIFTCRYTGNHGFLPLFEKAYHFFEMYAIFTNERFRQSSVPSYICQVGFPAKERQFEDYLRAFAPVVPLAAKMGNGHLDGLDALGWCEYCYFRGDLGAAENFARQAVIQARGSLQHETENRGLFFLLRIAVHSGNAAEIEKLFAQIKAQLDIEEYQNRYILYDLECGWFYAQTGQPSLVAGWLRNGALEQDRADGIFSPFEILVKARCFFAEGQYQPALGLLEQWESLDSFFLGKLEKTALAAACRLRLGDRRAALENLEAAWDISRTGGFDMPFIELGEDMRRLVSAAQNGPEEAADAGNPGAHKIPSCGIPFEWLELLRNRAAAYSKMLALAAPGGPRQAQGSPGGTFLRRREASILLALSQGLTREAIARQEGISLSGVKEHIKNLYRKLGAVNRADAVRVAIDKGLLKNSRQ